MKRSLTILGPVIVFALATSAQAAEPYLEFVEALRNRRYYDSAMLYLDNLEARPGVPDDVRQVIPFEKATTLQQSARSLTNMDLKTQQLSQAEALLEQFVKASPNHPRAGQANTERANILLGRAEVATWQSRVRANASRKGELQAEARALVKKARGIFQKAHDQHEARWKSFPKYINERENPRQFRERYEAEIDFIRAQLDLALTTYHEAQTYDREAPEFSQLLTKAAGEFNEIHSRYRTLVAGLYARMWQGKCFEEQNDLGKALGIYNELLEHGNPVPGQPPPKPNPVLDRLKDRVLHFRLICLNHEQRGDYKVVINEATEWLGGRRAATRIALGIQWERARAHEALAAKLQKQIDQTRSDRTVGEQEKSRAIAAMSKERTSALNSALNDAEYINNRFDGEFEDVSQRMIQSMKAALGKAGEDPNDYASAIGLARTLVNQIEALQNDLADPKNKSKQKELQIALQNHVAETIRILELSLQLAAAEEVGLDQANQARYLLSYMYFYVRDNYKSAVLGEFVGRHHGEEQSQLGLDCAYLGLSSFIQAYNDVPEGQDKDFEMRQIVRLGQLVSDRWPESESANDARMSLGNIFGQLNKPVEGGEWYGKVPPSAPQYAKAQIAAGQSYWSAYLAAARLPEDDPERPAIEELQKWQAAAQKHLETGLAEARKLVPEKATGKEDIYDEYIAAKVSLAQIRINQGTYQAAIDLLLKDPHSVMKAIVVPEGTGRPSTGIKSTRFAGLSYQLLLRGYVGTQKIDLALKAMEDLEKLTPDSEGVMQIYVQLGRELEKEIERLQQLNQTDRLAEVRTSFEQFLNELYKRKDSMTAGSLIWIAETYYGLAQGLDEDKAAATPYYNKAADTFQNIINSAESKGADWLEADRVTAVKLRLVNCRRNQGEYEAALALVAEVLSEKPRSLESQFEASYVLQDWADSGQGDNWKRFLDAINGTELADGKAKTWGWGGAAILLQRRLDAGVATPDQVDRMYEARYNSIWSRHRYAAAQSSTPERQSSLSSAKHEMEAFVAISADVPEEWREKFNAIYREILQSMLDAGMKDAQDDPVVVADIEWPTTVVATPEPAPTPVAANGNEIAKQKPTAGPVATEEAEEAGLMGPMIAMGLFAIACAAGVFYVMSKKGTPKPIAAYGDTSAPILPPQGSAPQRRKRPAGQRPSGKRPAGKPSTGRTAEGAAKKRPAGKPAAGGTTGNGAKKNAGTKPPARPKPKPRQEQP